MARLICSVFLTILSVQLLFAQTADGSFSPFITGPSIITASALQSDNKLILAGSVIAIGTARVTAGMVRLNTNGTIDNTFNIGTGASHLNQGSTTVRALLVQPDGKILVGGSFTSFNGQTTNIVRLNTDGSIDNTFNTGTGANSMIMEFALQSDNKIIVAGFFTSFNGTVLKGIARLNANGSIDNTFTPPAIEFLSGTSSTTRMGLAIQSDGKILMGSLHTHVNGVAKPYLVRLNSDGTLDNAFMTNLGTGLDNYVTSIAFQSDGKIIIAGNFTKVNSASANRNRIARLNTDGTLDSTFPTVASINSSIQTIKVIAADKILVSGGFTSPKNRILRLNSDGTVDSAFNPGTGFEPADGGSPSLVSFTHVQSDNKIISTGAFAKYNGTLRINLARLSDIGVVEAAYAPNPTGVATIYKSETLSSGKILLCGDFLFINGNYYPGIARLLATGADDNTFNLSGLTMLFGSIKTFGVQPSNGKILVGGDFVTSTTRGLAKLTANGALDNTFTGYTTLAQIVGSDGIYAIEPTADDKFIVGGSFSAINGVTKSNFAKLNTDGSLDNTFNSTGTDFVNRIIKINTRASDGKMILTEYSRNSDHQPDALISLANSDGTRVNSFAINDKFDGQYLHDAIFLPDNKIVIGGDFASFDGATAQKLVKVDDQGNRDFNFTNPTTYSNYKVTDLYYSPSINKVFVGKDDLYFSTIVTDANYFDAIDTQGGVILDALDVKGGISSIIPFGSSFLLAGTITKVGTSDVTSAVKINLPAAPTGSPSALAVSTLSLPRRGILTWTDNSSNEAGFEIQRSKTNNTTFELLATAPANAVTYTDQGSLDPATDYYYRVRAMTLGGQTAFSNEASITTLAATPPATPTGLAVGLLSQTQLVLNWTDNSSTESGFEIYRSTPTNSNFKKIQTTGSNVTSFIVSGLTAGTTYFFKVKAIKSDDASDFSNEATNTTFATPPNEWSTALTTTLGARSSGVALVLNGKAYVGLGRNGTGALKDWWEYNPDGNVWTQKLDFPGTARIGAVAFVVNGKGYVGTGNDFGGSGFKRDFYEYDAVANTWTPKADFPEDFNSGAGITSGAAFAIGNYGYVGLGNTGLNNAQAFFRFDPVANTWEAKANFGGAGRTGAVGFESNGKGYFGFGYGGLSANLKDMWEYNPSTNAWTSKANHTGAGRGGAAVTTVKGEAYLFAGEEGDFSSSVSTSLNTQYSSSTNAWISKVAIPAAIRTSAMAFTIGVKAYVFGGVNSTTYYSDLIAFTPTSALAPAAPGSASISLVSETSLKYTWTDISNDETNFVLEVAQGSGSFVVVASLPAGTTEYTHTGLTSGTQYKYRVKAINLFGSSAYTTSEAIATMTPPSNLAVQSFGTSQLVLTWTDNTASETAFEIYRSSPDNTNYALIRNVGVNSTTATEIGLTPGSTYYYKIRAITSTTSSAYSNEVSQTLLNLPPAPSNLAVQSFTANQVVITWTDNTTNETGFEIYRSMGNSLNYVKILTTAPDVTSFTNTPLSAGTTYYYKVRAASAIGFSLYSNEINQKTLLIPPPAPAAPSGLKIQSASATTNEITLTWTDNSSTETGFELFRSDGDNANYTLLKTLTANVITFTDATGQQSVKYFYKIRAVNDGVYSAFSPEVSTIITGINEEHWDLDVSVFPNPAKEILLIKNPGRENIKITIVNLLGQPMTSVDVGAESEAHIPCSSWSPGVYIVKTLSPNNKIVRIFKE
jgi:uncharacterized delta-60 repeat protein